MDPRRNRLLHVSQPTDAGVARCVLEYAAAQRAAGWDVRVACPADGRLATDLERAGVPWVRWEATRSPGPSVVAETRRLTRILRETAPDVVHLHSAKAGLCGRLALRGAVPTVFQPHAWSFEAVQGPVAAATRAWERLGARWATVTVCVSAAELDLGRAAGVAPSSAVVVPNGVDLDALRPADAAQRATARAELGLPSGPLALCVGRLARQKGQDVLLQAWPQVRAALPDALLVLVGDGPEEPALRASAGEGVRFAGPQGEVSPWLAAADVVVAPSRWEGMALVPLEAMARARSVVASDVTGVRESVPSTAGAVVPPESPAPLAQALVARLSGAVDADEEGRRGRLHVEAEHDIRRTAHRLERAYAEALAAGAATPRHPNWR